MKALVLGAGGFIGHNLVKRLKKEGWYVEGIDLKIPVFEPSLADKFTTYDLSKNFVYEPNYFDRIYQLAADMGGAGFVFTGDNDFDILHNSLSINLNILPQLKYFKGRFFYSSSVCVYPAGYQGNYTGAYPAHPPSNYGWEKLTSERLIESYAKDYGLNKISARFHNTYGPYGTFEGGREKAPAALIRKAILDPVIEVWGNGEQLRPFIFIDDLLDAIEVLMQATQQHGPYNIGPDRSVTINQMLDIIAPGKPRKYIPGPTGEQLRYANPDEDLRSHGWTPRTSLEDGLKTTYDWIKGQINGRI